MRDLATLRQENLDQEINIDRNHVCRATTLASLQRDRQSVDLFYGSPVVLATAHSQMGYKLLF